MFGTARTLKNITAAIALLGITALGASAGTPADTSTAEAGEKTTKSAPAKPGKKAKHEKAAKKETTKVKATTLVKAFEDNELKSDKKYKGKTLEVTGTVEEIDTDTMDKDVYILRMSGGEYSFLTVNFRDIPTDQLDKVDKGDKVTVIGEFEDGGDLGVEIKGAHIA